MRQSNTVESISQGILELRDASSRDMTPSPQPPYRNTGVISSSTSPEPTSSSFNASSSAVPIPSTELQFPPPQAGPSPLSYLPQQAHLHDNRGYIPEDVEMRPVRSPAIPPPIDPSGPKHFMQHDQQHANPISHLDPAHHQDPPNAQWGGSPNDRNPRAM